MPVVPCRWRLSQEENEMMASLGYSVRPFLKTNKQEIIHIVLIYIILEELWNVLGNFGQIT
jgi:hypothetical protein